MAPHPEHRPLSGQTASRFESRSQGLLLGALLGVLCFATTWALREAPVILRAPLLLAVAFSFTSLAFGGFLASLATFFPAAVAALLFLVPHVHFGEITDPVERARFWLSVSLVVLVGGLIAAQRVERWRLTARARQLRESEERYRNLLEQASDAILVTDETHHLVIVNPRACELLGYSADELVGRDVRTLISPESLKRQPFRYEELRTKPLVLAEREMVRKDGGRLPVEVTARLMTDGRTQAIARDITERLEAAEALRRLETRLQHTQRLESVGRLAAGVAHDFNSLLTVVLGSAQLLEAAPSPERVRERAGEIIEAGQRGAALTQQLLAFSRKGERHPEDLDLNRVVSGFAKILLRLVGGRATLQLQLAPEPIPVRADLVQLEQVLLSLVTNALDAIEPGGTIEIRTRKERLAPPAGDSPREEPRDFAVLAVRDDGIGMDGETQAQIFEPFFTTKAVGKGTGLGLATAHAIVRQLGGFIRVESAPGRGTTMHFCLPASGAAAIVPPAASRADRPALRVVLVEDEESVRRVVRLLLERSGLQVLECSHGDEALRALAEWTSPPALLVTDIRMPGMDGLHLARECLARWPSLPVLFFSGYAEDGLEFDAPEVPGRHYLKKPFTSEQLTAAVDLLLPLRSEDPA